MLTASTLAPSALGMIVKPLINEIIETAKKKINAPERIVAKSLSSIELGKRVYNVINVKTLWNVEKEVSLFEFYYPSRLKFSANSKPQQIDHLSSFPKDFNYVIQGTAGQGKSIFLRYLYGQIAFTIETEKKIPAFIELRRLSLEKNLEALIGDALERLGLPNNSDLIDAYLASEKIILLMDGFDEIDADLGCVVKPWRNFEPVGWSKRRCHDERSDASWPNATLYGTTNGNASRIYCREESTCRVGQRKTTGYLSMRCCFVSVPALPGVTSRNGLATGRMFISALAAGRTKASGTSSSSTWPVRPITSMR